MYYGVGLRKVFQFRGKPCRANEANRVENNFHCCNLNRNYAGSVQRIISCWVIVVYVRRWPNEILIRGYECWRILIVAKISDVRGGFLFFLTGCETKGCRVVDAVTFCIKN